MLEGSQTIKYYFPIICIFITIKKEMVRIFTWCATVTGSINSNNIDVNLLTKGSDILTYEENITIFKHAFKYIKDSNRFTIV
jgi:hypothetical protein